MQIKHFTTYKSIEIGLKYTKMTKSKKTSKTRQIFDFRMEPKINIAVCKTQMPPFPNMWRVGLTFDLDLWPTDLNVNRDHLLIKDYLPTKFEASGEKHSRVIRCTRFERLTWPLTLTFDLLTWLSIGIIYSSRTIYLPSLKLLGQSVVELSVAQGFEDWHDLWPWPLTYQPDYQ